MSSLLKKVLVKNQRVKEFIPIGIQPGQIAEKVSISVNGQESWFDVTERQCLAADGPVTFGIIFHESELGQGIPKTLYLKIEVPVDGRLKVMTKVVLQHCDSIDLEADRLQLYYILRVKNKHVNGFRRRLIINKMFSLAIERGEYDDEMTKRLYHNLVATYSFPRQVFLIRLGENIIFPIDICFFNRDKGQFAFGLKIKNRLNQMVQDVRKVTIYTVSSEAYETIYSMSKSSAWSSHGEPPKFVGDKMTIDILEHKNLRSHIFYTGVISQVENIRKQNWYLHHIHFLMHLSCLSSSNYSIQY